MYKTKDILISKNFLLKLSKDIVCLKNIYMKELYETFYRNIEKYTNIRFVKKFIYDVYLEMDRVSDQPHIIIRNNFSLKYNKGNLEIVKTDVRNKISLHK